MMDLEVPGQPHRIGHIRRDECWGSWVKLSIYFSISSSVSVAQLNSEDEHCPSDSSLALYQPQSFSKPSLFFTDLILSRLIFGEIDALL